MRSRCLFAPNFPSALVSEGHAVSRISASQFPRPGFSLCFNFDFHILVDSASKFGEELQKLNTCMALTGVAVS